MQNQENIEPQPLSLGMLYSLADACREFDIKNGTLRDHIYTPHRAFLKPIRMGARINTVLIKRFRPMITYDVVILTRRMIALYLQWQPGQPDIIPSDYELAQIMTMRRVAGYLIDRGYPAASPLESTRKAIQSGRLDVPTRVIGRNTIMLRSDVDKALPELLARTRNTHQPRRMPTDEDAKQILKLRYESAMTIREIKENYPQYPTAEIVNLVKEPAAEYMQGGGILRE